MAAAVMLARIPMASAQAGGSVAGTIKDLSGGLIPGVTVSLANTAFGYQLTTVTDGQRAYSFPNVPVGRYDLNITLDGFKPQRYAGMAVNHQQPPAGRCHAWENETLGTLGDAVGARGQPEAELRGANAQ